jgi:hypothetical protein
VPKALEVLVRALGYDAIRLHVFGDYDVARHLYRSVGYWETDVSMIKRLAWYPRAPSGPTATSRSLNGPFRGRSGGAAGGCVFRRPGRSPGSTSTR